MADADVYGVVRALLTSALREADQAVGSAQQVLDAVRGLERPGAWKDVLPWVLVKVSELDPRLSVGVEGDAIVLSFKDPALPGRARLWLTGYGAGPVGVRVEVRGDVALQVDSLSLTGSGWTSWGIDADGPTAAEGEGRIRAEVRVPAAREIAAEAGTRLAIADDLRIVAELSRSTPVWRLEVVAPRLTASVSPGALLGIGGVPGAGLAFGPTLSAADGQDPTLLLGLA